MSGIFGFFDPDGRLPADASASMAGALALTQCCHVAIHRSGPACIGVVDKGIFPGASQVLRGEKTGRHAVFQGEIIGFSGKEESMGPVARARRAFCEELDDERLASAIGPFSAAILDEKTNTIEVVGDRYGMYLTFYARVGQTVVFAGQAKAVLATRVVPTEVDQDALAMMLTIGEVVGDLTLFRAIRALPAAGIARIDSNGISVRQYWRYSFQSNTGVGFHKAAERAGGLLRRAVVRACGSHRRVGVPLSGGLDSRVILAATPDPSCVSSYTWGVQGCRDLRYAERVTDVLGSLHHSYVYDPAYIGKLGERGVWLTEGLCDASDMHVLPYVESVRPGSQMVLDGFAGDVILGGNFLKRDWWHARDPDVAAAALWRWRAVLLERDVRDLLLDPARHGDVFDRAYRLFRDCYTTYEGHSQMDRAMAFLLDNRMRRCTCGGTHLFRWLVELHFPFYDNDFFDHVARLPHAWRYRHKIYIEMIRRCFRTVGGIPWQRTGLPARTRWPARFFTAVAHRANEWAARCTAWPDMFGGRHVSRFDQWFRGPLRGFVERVLLSERCASRGVFRPEGVRRIIDRHQAGADHSKLIGVLIGLELFYRLFIDDFAAANKTFSCAHDLQGDVAALGVSVGSTK